MNQKTRVAIIFGGRSAEHEVSLQSAKNIIDAIDKSKYELVLIGIDKGGRWYLNEQSTFLLNENDPKLIHLNKSNEEIAIVPKGSSNQLIAQSTLTAKGHIDVAFPVIHGPYGEEGSIQGLLKLANIPYVGADILGSAIGMDKDVMKRLLRDAGIPTPKFLVLENSSPEAYWYEQIIAALGLPLFIKPANLGSSVGVHKVRTREEFEEAVKVAFTYHNKILVEEFIQGREIECSVLGNENPITSIPGEIIVRSEFYSYEAKYIDEHGAFLEIPAKIPDEIMKAIQEYARRTFRVLCCRGMARVDFFLRGKTEILVNEINTIPGFTKISMYPRLWEASGIAYPELIDRLIQLAIERHKNEQGFKSSPE